MAAQAKSKPSAPAGATASTGSKKPKDYKSLTGRQKAAIFLVSLGSELSAEIFKHLREDEIETLTFEIARLDTVDSEIKQAILE
ncbi:MAG TPA: flagellar motor switch protein FliG, partial [Treponemataceae bacterium]|nr:flagellar motor switch protein FliG [Treponemataceae bacterium]